MTLYNVYVFVVGEGGAGLIQPAKDRKSKNLDPPEEEGILLPNYTEILLEFLALRPKTTTSTLA